MVVRDDKETKGETKTRQLLSSIRELLHQIAIREYLLQRQVNKHRRLNADLKHYVEEDPRYQTLNIWGPRGNALEEMIQIHMQEHEPEVRALGRARRKEVICILLELRAIQKVKEELGAVLRGRRNSVTFPTRAWMEDVKTRLDATPNEVLWRICEGAISRC
ncbi:hypothetical protein BDW69DRAFT_178612 [Aspergillus filifer]